VFLILNNDLAKEMEEVAQSDVLSCNVPAVAEELRKIMTNLTQYSQSWLKNKPRNSSMHSILFCNSSN